MFKTMGKNIKGQKWQRVFQDKGLGPKPVSPNCLETNIETAP